MKKNVTPLVPIPQPTEQTVSVRREVRKEVADIAGMKSRRWQDGATAENDYLWRKTA